MRKIGTDKVFSGVSENRKMILIRSKDVNGKKLDGAACQWKSGPEVRQTESQAQKATPRESLSGSKILIESVSVYNCSNLEH